MQSTYNETTRYADSFPSLPIPTSRLVIYGAKRCSGASQLFICITTHQPAELSVDEFSKGDSMTGGLFFALSRANDVQSFLPFCANLPQ